MVSEDLRNLIRMPFTNRLGREEKGALLGTMDPIGGAIACTDHLVRFFEIQVGSR